MSPHITIDGQIFDPTIDYFRFHGVHQLVDQNELRKLRLFTRLTGVSFGNTNLDDSGLAHVCAVKTLETLDLQSTRVSNAGLAHLTRLPRLRYLRLKENDQLTNECIPHLLRLTNLAELQVHETAITETGLAQLHTLERLRDLCVNVWDGNYTFSGLSELSTQMPSCTILAKGHGEFRNGKFSGEWRDR